MPASASPGINHSELLTSMLGGSFGWEAGIVAQSRGIRARGSAQLDTGRRWRRLFADRIPGDARPSMILSQANAVFLARQSAELSRQLRLNLLQCAMKFRRIQVRLAMETRIQSDQDLIHFV